MRYEHGLLALSMMAASACSAPLPGAPTESANPQFVISFIVANPGSLSLSEPEPCPGDFSTCARGSQPQGPATTSNVTVRTYSLPAGTYRLTGVLQPQTPAGASVTIRIDESSSIGGGVPREGPVLGFVAFRGDAPPATSVVSQVCGATLTNLYGALEWSMSFRVVSTPEAVAPLCL